jgi:arginyl-tRNA synthetase
MNGWVYDGFEKTYARMGVDFDKYYYESETYILGKKVVEEGLEKGVFYKKEDGSVWIDLQDEGLDQKLLLRSDGTSVYMTQDIGTAIQRYEDFGMDGMIYTVGNEQDYHFKVLFIILGKLGYEWAKKLYHLSYGMVDLPEGKMKSREGTVVDADDLMEEMYQTAKSISEELGKTDGMGETEKEALYEMVGMGALKYFILKVDPSKRMLFNPKESVQFQGNTGPFIQYTHARIRSLLAKGKAQDKYNAKLAKQYVALQPSEQAVVKQLAQYPSMVQNAANEHSPSIIAAYAYDLVKLYNALYQQLPILSDDNDAAIAFRLLLSESTASVVKNAMGLLGIQVPEQM